jgi:hypothetical protein
MAMSIPRAIVEGAARATGARTLVLALWLVNVLLAVAVAVPFADALQSSIVASLVHEKLRTGFDAGWFGDLQARGLLATFSPFVIGTGPFFTNLESWLHGDLWTVTRPVLVLGIGYLLLWILLLGGILDRLSVRGEYRPNLAGFLTGSGRYFFRFFRLALLSGALYVLVYLLGRRVFIFIDDRTRDVTVERTVMLWTMAGAALIAFLLCVVNAVFDYAKIATVVEGRQAMVGAVLRAVRFVVRHPVKTLGLYGALGLVGVALLALYAAVAPGARQASVPGVVFAFLLGQLYLVVKLVLRLTFYGSQMAVFEALGRRPAPGP